MNLARYRVFFFSFSQQHFQFSHTIPTKESGLSVRLMYLMAIAFKIGDTCD